MNTSKIVRRKDKTSQITLEKDDNLECIMSYQNIDGFTRFPVASDGNCFYTATGFFCGINASKMRELVMKYFIFKKAEYSIFFETEPDFMNAVKTNSCSNVWNSELCDIAPHAVAQILSRDIIIHNYNSKSIKEIHIPAEKKLYPPLHLFRSSNHYEILISNTVNPNKNIWPYSSFNVIIDLTLDEDDSDIDDFKEYDNVCKIRF
jgi:hypothetical protein